MVSGKMAPVKIPQVKMAQVIMAQMAKWVKPAHFQYQGWVGVLNGGLRLGV